MECDAHNLDITDLRIFQLLEQGMSVQCVSDCLGLSQPAVSQRIRRLEERLAVPLTERAGRGLKLTAAGRVLATCGQKVASECNLAFAKIAAIVAGTGGTLRLAGFPSASATLVPELMRLLRINAPDVALQYREAEPPQALELLRGGEVDCALVFSYENELKLDQECEFLPLWQEQLRLVVPALDARISAAGTVALVDFAQNAWIAGCQKCRWHLLEAARLSGFLPQIVQETDNIPAMVAMAAAGGAVALAPDLALAGMGSLPAGVCAVPLDPPLQRTVGLVVQAGHADDVLVRLALQQLALINADSLQLASCA